jgi:hypothetical protein
MAMPSMPMRILDQQRDVVLKLRRRRRANRIAGFVRATVGWTIYAAAIVWILILAMADMSRP